MRMNIEHTRLEEPLLWLLYRWNVVKAEANGGGKTDDDKDERSLIRRLFGGKR